MSIGVASVQQKEFITASAVYYREQRFAAKNAVVVVAGQYLGPMSGINETGTVSDIRNSGTTMA